MNARWLDLSSLLGVVGMNSAPSGGFWMPEQGSTVAPMVDAVFDFIYWLSVVFFVGIVAAMLFFAFRYRRRKEGDHAESQVSHNTPIEIVWTVIPLLLACYIFWIGFKGYIDLRTPPANSYQVSVRAQTWTWEFTYPSGAFTDTLRVPVDTPVELTMTSEDLLHSFFVPEFRIKMDVVPGKYTKAWFQAVEPGTYNVFCTEYCGTGHSDMITAVEVLPAGEFQVWLEKASNPYPDDLYPTPAAKGERAYQLRGCTQCHSVDGTAGIGPSLQGAWGKQETMTDGSTITVDENYIRESLLDPQAKIVGGYEGVMPTYQGRLSDQEITFIIAFIKSLGGEDS